MAQDKPKQEFEKLEENLKKRLGYNHFVACSSGTAALHLALEALALPPASKVIVPDYTMIACARAVVLAGHVPVFVDCDDNLQLSPHWLEVAVRRTRNVQAIMAVHIYGKSCNMDAIAKVAKDNDLRLIEDLAEAHLLHKHQDTDIGCYSFYHNKLIAGEEGGGLGTENEGYAYRCRQLRCLGFKYSDGVPTYDHAPRGHNYRLSNAHAEIINKKLEGDYLAQRIKLMSSQWQEYASVFEPTNLAIYHTVNSFWVYPLNIKGMDRNTQIELVKVLNSKHNIAARCGFQPMTKQEEFIHAEYCGNGNSWHFSRQVIYLPLDAGRFIGREEVKKILETIRELTS